MKNDCIAIVQYRPLEALPPVMTLLNVLKRIGENVVFIGIEGPTGAAFFESAGVPYRFLIPTHKSRLARGATFYPRRWQLLSILKELRREYGKVTIWFQECHSAALAGNAMYAFGRPIVTFFEYECNLGERWFGFDLERLYHTAVVVECERTRAEMTQKNHGLSETPLVIANKPEIDASQIPPLNDEAKDVFSQIGERPVFMYQGNFGWDRKYAPFILETIAKKCPGYCVLVLPGNVEVKKLVSSYPNAFMLNNWISPPGHLAVTARATVGIATYFAEGDGVCAQNARYCAPNKIYEYAALGVPTLGNDIPGLRTTIGAARAGILCDMTEDAIVAAANELVNNIADYRARARQFYDGTNIEAQIKAVIARHRGQ